MCPKYTNSSSDNSKYNYNKFIIIYRCLPYDVVTTFQRSRYFFTYLKPDNVC